jgi:hypothetical protein
MDYQALFNEIDTDPLARGYAGMSDAETAIDLNTNLRDVPGTVLVENVFNYLTTQLDGSGLNQRSTYDMIREYAEAGTVRGAAPGGSGTVARRSGARMILERLRYGGASAVFQVDNDNIRNQFLALGADSGNGPSVLTNQQLLELDALATRQASRAEEIGFPNPTAQDITTSKERYGG